MILLLFPALLILHGLIHLIGFSKEWKLGPPSILKGKTLFRLTNRTAKTLGILWFLTCLMLITAAGFYLLEKDWFWIASLVGIILSQVLIIVYWQDAKYGTIVNIIILLVVIVNIARVDFDNKTTAEIERILKVSADVKEKATAKSIKELPAVIQKWLKVSRASNVLPSHVKITQRGAMRTKPHASWMDFSATQFYTIVPPAFIWKSQIDAGSFLTIAGRDKYENGKGNMLIKPLSIYPMVNSSGDEIDQGTMLRYMGEIIWFPEAALMDYFQWEEVDSAQARLTMNYLGVTATGTFTFDETGLMKSFSAQRFGTFNGQFRKETWEVKVNEHKEMNDHIIPSKCEVTWKLKEGDFAWLKLEIKEIEYHYR